MPTKSHGAVIRRLREEKGLSCSQLATLVNVDRTFLWKIENDYLAGSPKTRLAIANALGVSLDDITYFVPPQQRATRVKEAA